MPYISRIELAQRAMPVLGKIRAHFKQERPLLGRRIAACMHVTAETANLILALRDGGADLSVCASNLLSTQDDVVADLSNMKGISVFARRGMDSETYYKNIHQALEIHPDIIMDDGSDLTKIVIWERKDLLPNIIGGTEETTTGVLRLRNMEREKILAFPMIAVNDAKTKSLFDNRYGTGQSALDGIIRATNILIAGTKVVVAGYGQCGRGIALRAKGLGASVIITEIDPVRALEAVMDGFQVMTMFEASSIGDIFITATGNQGIIREEHFLQMRRRPLIANVGHFNNEISLADLNKISVEENEIRPMMKEYLLKNGLSVIVLAEGRLVNLACAEGHPPSVMDLSFANQALAVEFITLNGRNLESKVYSVSEEVDNKIAYWKLESMGVNIDTLTKSQRHYLQSWSEGT